MKTTQKTMNRILLIETATDVCSVAIADGEQIVSAEHISEAKSQASRLAPMILDIMDRADTPADRLAAVAVSSGPGSYTGLRVGVSTAKGICFGAGIPLIGIETLTIIAFGAMKTDEVKNSPEDTLIIPMTDARRMEVYTALYDAAGRRLTDTAAIVLTPETFIEELECHSRIVFTGDGATKYEPMIPSKYRGKCIFIPSHPEAENMAVPAFRALQEKRFEDTAYFEPFYLKEFIAADPSRKLEAVLHPDRHL